MATDTALPDVDEHLLDVRPYQVLLELTARCNLRCIYCAVSPMLGGTKRTAIKAYLNQVLTSRTAMGDNNVAILDFAPPAADAWGCGHPNAATHVIMAGVLEQALKTDLGW